MKKFLNNPWVVTVGGAIVFAALSAAEAEQLLTLLEKLNSDWDTKFRKREDEKHVEIR